MQNVTAWSRAEETPFIGGYFLALCPLTSQTDVTQRNVRSNAYALGGGMARRNQEVSTAVDGLPGSDYLVAGAEDRNREALIRNERDSQASCVTYD